MKKSKSILIKNADYIVTLNDKLEVLHNASILVEGGIIKEVKSKKIQADKIVNASGMVLYPGFINTHLHSPQVFHRHCPVQQNKSIAEWIKITTLINREIDAESMYWGALVCFTELMLSGVTTTLDYFYPFVKGKRNIIESTLKAAQDIGIRLTSIRGSMSRSKKQGTLYDEDVVEPTDQILDHSQSLINKFHDTNEFSMLRMGIGPCLPFASGEKDYLEAAKLARKNKGLIMQTHAAESIWEVDYCKKKFGETPIGLMEKTGFLGSDVSLVHGNIIDTEEIKLLGSTQTNVVLTPICNMRDAADGNGIAPIELLRQKGANVSIGVDGPASNDSMNIQDEMRYLRVVSRAKEGLFWDRKGNQTKYSYRHPLEVFSLTNRGGAKTLNRDDIGSIEVGKAADIAIFNPDDEISQAGSVCKWASLISCTPIKPKYLIVNGRFVVEDGMITLLDQNKINKNFRKFHQKIIYRAEGRLRTNFNYSVLSQKEVSKFVS